MIKTIENMRTSLLPLFGRLLDKSRPVSSGGPLGPIPFNEASQEILDALCAGLPTPH
jgi:hypothetical protein